MPDMIPCLTRYRKSFSESSRDVSSAGPPPQRGVAFIPMGSHKTARWASSLLLSLALVGGVGSVMARPAASPEALRSSLVLADTPTPTESVESAPDTSTATSTAITEVGGSVGEDVAPDGTPPMDARTTTSSDATGLAAPTGDGGTLGSDSSSCLTGAEHVPTGELVVAPGASEPSGGGDPTTYLVEIERGLAVDAECFAAEVDRILADDRSWGGDGSMSLQRVDSGPISFTVTLASPATTDTHCRPLETNGIYSCWASDGRAMINVWRWEHGTDEYSDDLDTYREYVINHEVGHAFGHGHRDCTDIGDLAPVMAQQTKTLAGCRQNGWPLTWER